MIGSEFNRIRIGIGRPEKMNVSSYVLNDFPEIEVSFLKKIILKSCEGINERDIYFANNLEYYLGGGTNIDNPQIRIFSLNDPSPCI